MNRAVLATLAAAGLLAACRHAQKTETPEGPPAHAPEAGRAGVPPRAGRPAVPATPEALLGPEEIAHVQRALARRGLLEAHREGRLDEPTSGALRRFQRQRGLAATGFPDRATLRDLGIDPEQAYRRGRSQRAEGTASGSGSGSTSGAGSSR